MDETWIPLQKAIHTVCHVYMYIHAVIYYHSQITLAVTTVTGLKYYNNFHHHHHHHHHHHFTQIHIIQCTTSCQLKICSSITTIKLPGCLKKNTLL